MDVDVPHLKFSYTDDDEKNLGKLLEAFGSVVSLEDIASAYCTTGRNLQSAAEALCNIRGDIAGPSSSRPQDIVKNISRAPPESLSSNVPENEHSVNLKSKKCPATMGTVSSVIGKNYIKPRPQTTGLNEKLKPVKIHSEEFPVSEIWEEKNQSTSPSEFMDSDVQEFIFKMLGNGFQLEKSVIKDVVGQCGYNVPMSMDKLLDLSAASLVKSDDIIGASAEIVKPAAGRSKPDVNNETKSRLTETRKNDIERDILNALFCAPEIFEEKQVTNPIRPARHSPYGRSVAKPLKDTIIEDFTFINRQPVNDKNDEESNYEEFREAVLEYWVIMKEYYKSAVDAYTRKDYENAEKLMEQGNFFMTKAREADEKSAQKLTGESDEEVISLNMHYLEPREALHQMKLNLKSFSGLPSIRCLKVVAGTDAGDAKERRRKRLITRLLEKEGIPWTEEGNGSTIAIQVNTIDPMKLSFANK